VTDLVFYEQPLNERMRTLLRLEHLFDQAAYTLRGYSLWDSRTTVAALIDIVDVLGRSDMKTELLKELERHKAALGRWQGSQAVDHSQLQSVLNELDECEQAIQAANGQLGQSLRDDDLIAAIRQRSTIAGGTCNFDLPQFHYWLQQPPEQRLERLEAWYRSLENIRRPVSLMLNILRESADPVSELAPEGFFQRTLESQTPYQLIRVGLSPEEDCFAEISAGKHRLTIRMLQPQAQGRPRQVDHGVSFELVCCVI
jgi:cell division protein ZapD